MRRLFLCLVFIAGCATLRPVQPLPVWHDDMSDKCSVPKALTRFLVFTDEQSQCCVRHDSGYYTGGSAALRLKFDMELRACLIDRNLNAKLADVVFDAVRTGGEPWYKQPYCWGFGVGMRDGVWGYTNQPAPSK